MLRGIAKIYARLSYLFQLEVEGHKNDINAATAKRNAEEKRTLVTQLNAEADAIEQNMKQVDAEEEERRKGEEYLKLTDKEKYDDQQASKKEKDAALQMITEKRGLATQEAKNVSDAEQVAQVLRGRAADSRAFADKIRQI
jgi:electron transfer flavoprotein alpha subunit